MRGYSMIMSMLRIAARAATWWLALFCLAGAALAPQMDAATPLQRADTLWQAGHVTEAWVAYASLEKQHSLPPSAQLRLAGLLLARGTCGDAELLAARALGQPLTRDDAAVAYLMRAECATRRQAQDSATAAWSAIDSTSPYAALAHVLRGEHALHNGDGAAAVTQFTTALRHDLPAPWAALAHLRLAQTSDDLAAAQHHLAALPPALPAPDPVSRPLLPLPALAITAQAADLRTVLRAPAEDQPQLRGQHLLAAGLWMFTATYFDRVAQGKEADPRAPAYAAYARYQAGEHRAATDALRSLHARFPDEPLVTTLYATVALQGGYTHTAAMIVERAAMEQPLDPALALVRSDLLAAQHRYADAVAERRRARDSASTAQRGRYAVAVAQQHLQLAYNVCSDGIAAAQTAATLAPDTMEAWQTLAAVPLPLRALCRRNQRGAAGRGAYARRSGVPVLFGRGVMGSRPARRRTSALNPRRRPGTGKHMAGTRRAHLAPRRLSHKKR